MSKSTLFKAAHEITRKLVAGHPAVSYRMTFGLALRHLNSMEKKPMTETFTVVAIDDMQTRKDGAISFLRATISVDGIVPIQLSSRKEDTDVLELVGKELTVGGKHLVAVHAAIERTAAPRQVDAEIAALPPIVGVSEKQAAFAETKRPFGYRTAMATIADFEGRQPEYADAFEKMRSELRTNVDAGFWLDALNEIHGDLTPLRDYMIAAGRL